MTAKTNQIKGIVRYKLCWHSGEEISKARRQLRAGTGSSKFVT